MIKRDESGIYRGEWKGKLIAYPSVTTVLSILNDFSRVDKEVLDRAAKWGTALHQLISLYNENNLNMNTLDPMLEACLEQYKKFLKDTGFEPKMWEKAVVNDEMEYAGTYDLLGLMHSVPVLIDTKSRPANRKDGLQLAAYRQAIEPLKRPERTFVLEITPEYYKLTEFGEFISDFSVFISCLKIWRWKNANK